MDACTKDYWSPGACLLACWINTVLLIQTPLTNVDAEEETLPVVVVILGCTSANMTQKINPTTAYHILRSLVVDSAMARNTASATHKK